jgi:hypothetical protein
MKVVRCILQGLPQTYIHSLTRSSKSSQMFLLLLYLVKLWIYVCRRPCKIHLTTFIRSGKTMNIQLWEVLVKYIWLLLLYLVKLEDLMKVVRCILQGLPQTYIHSLTRSSKSSKMFLATTSTNVYSQFNKITMNIRLWKSL